MKDILLVVDMQKGFTGCERTAALAVRVRDLLEKNIFDAVVATKFVNAPGSIYEKLFSWRRLESHAEQELVDGYEKYIDTVFEKTVYNCVTPSFLERLCQLNDGCYPAQVYIAGVDTDCCVLSIATALFEHHICPIVLTRYVDSNGGRESHEAGLLCLRRLIGAGQLLDGQISAKEDLHSK